MSDLNPFEKLLRNKATQPVVPRELREKVLETVTDRLQRKTFFDDLKLLASCFAVLVAVVCCLWISMEEVSRDLRQLTNSKEETVKTDFSLRRNSLQQFERDLDRLANTQNN